MTLGEKLKEIRKRFELSQEELAEIINVSRQAITKWENDNGMPDISNLKELSKIFGITIDYLLSESDDLPLIAMKISINKDKYKNKIFSYDKIIEEYFGEYEVYSLMREKKLNKAENVLDFLIGAGTINFADSIGDMSPYCLVKKEKIKLLINIKNWTLTAQILPEDIDENKFIVKNSTFRKLGLIRFKEKNER